MDNHLKIIMNNVNNVKIDVYLMSFMINKMSNILLSHFEFKSRVVYPIAYNSNTPASISGE